MLLLLTLLVHILADVAKTWKFKIVSLFHKNHVNLLLGLETSLITLVFQVVFFPLSKILQVICLNRSLSRQICFSFHSNCSIPCKQNLALLQLEWNSACLKFILFKRHLFRMGHRHSYGHFLPRFIVYITDFSTKSTVSCPECVSMIWMQTVPIQ